MIGYGGVRLMALATALGCGPAACREFSPIGPANEAGDAPGSTPESTQPGGTSTAGGGSPAGRTPPRGPAVSLSEPGLKTHSAGLVDRNGNPVVLHGITWGGFDVGTTVTGFPQGTTLTGDFATVVRRMYLLGFNTVRLPFSFKQLLGSATPATINGACTHTLQTAIAASVTPPNGTAGIAYELPNPPTRVLGRCNDYIPSDTTLNRFTWMVQFLAQNGFYVVLVNDLHNDNTALADPDGWATDWVQLLQHIGTTPSVAQHVLVDLLNEPDVDSVDWQANGQTPGAGDLYLKAMDGIAAAIDAPLFLLQGCGQLPIGVNWGDGFDTNPTDIHNEGMSDPNPFFTALVGRAYVDRVLVAPHVFGPDVTFNGTDSNGAPLYHRLTSSFGYLTQTGYCTNNHCTPFAALLGAFGSAFSQSDAEQTMSDLATYMNNSAPANDGQHAAMANWIYWTWETGSLGTLQSNSDGALAWTKLTYLINNQHLQLLPWSH